MCYPVAAKKSVRKLAPAHNACSGCVQVPLDECIKDKLTTCNTDLVVIPGGMASQLQPLDVLLNKPIEDWNRVLYTGWLVSDTHELMPSD